MGSLFDLDLDPPPSSWPQSDPKLWLRDGGTEDTHGRCTIPVMARDGWEPCPRLAESTHHRNHHHTDNRPSNRLTTCGGGTTGHHGYIEAYPEEARLFRWSVTRHRVSAEPVWLWHPVYGLGWYRLGDDYSVTPCGPPSSTLGP